MNLKNRENSPSLLMKIYF